MATQQEIANDLGLNQSAISDAFKALGIDKEGYKELSVADARKVVIRHYSDIAANRAGVSQYNLTKERARESKLKGDLLQFQIQEKAGTLVPADKVEELWTSLVVAARTELLLIPEKLVSSIKALYGVDIDHGMVENHIHDSLTRLANADLVDDDVNA